MSKFRPGTAGQSSSTSTGVPIVYEYVYTVPISTCGIIETLCMYMQQNYFVALEG